MSTMKLLASAAFAMFALSACSRAVTTQDEAAARIEAGSALNARTGTYRVGDVEIELTKVVQLPGDELGLRFVFHSDSADCCSLFPRVALEPGGSANPVVPSRYVVILNSDINADGTLDMRLSEDGGSALLFLVDFKALNVALP